METKFRAWDKIDKEMMFPKWEEGYIGGGNKKIGLYIYRSKTGHSSLSYILKHPELFIPMQYTGLKDVGLWPESKFDKAGNALELKEIYGHDIVEVVSNNVVADGYAYEKSGQRPNGEKFVVSHTKAGYTLIPVESFDLSKEPYCPYRMGFVNNYSFANAAGNSLKVIGNIHQHPELLKK